MNAANPPPDPVRIHCEERGRLVIARVTGADWLAAGARIAEHLSRSVRPASPDLLLDLAGLAFINTVGIAAMLAADRRVRDVGGHFAVAAPQPAVERILRLMRVNEVFPIHPSIDGAIKAFSGNRT